MSSDSVELLHLRLRKELDRIGLKLAEASRICGEPNAQRLKDVVSGRVRCPADLVERLAPTGIDVMYVITGHAQGSAQNANGASTHHLTTAEEELLKLYRAASLAQQMKAVAALSGGPELPPDNCSGGKGIKVSGRGHRVAGRDFNERKE